MENEVQNSASYWIHRLNMTPHPEGGYFKEVYRSEMKVKKEGTEVERSAMTSIYYLLENESFSAFHRIKSPESWYFHQGAPLLIYSFEGGKLVCRELSDEEDGSLQITMEPDIWFAARLKTPHTFCLVSCAVAPGFEYEEFELINRATLLSEYPDSEKEIIELTR